MLITGQGHRLRQTESQTQRPNQSGKHSRLSNYRGQRSQDHLITTTYKQRRKRSVRVIMARTEEHDSQQRSETRQSHNNGQNRNNRDNGDNRNSMAEQSKAQRTEPPLLRRHPCLNGTEDEQGNGRKAAGNHKQFLRAQTGNRVEDEVTQQRHDTKDDKGQERDAAIDPEVGTQNTNIRDDKEGRKRSKRSTQLTKHPTQHKVGAPCSRWPLGPRTMGCHPLQVLPLQARSASWRRRRIQGTWP